MKYLKTFESINEDFTFEILDYNVDYDMINENYNYDTYKIDHYDNKGVEIVTLSPNQILKLNNLESKNRNLLNNLNNFKGKTTLRNGKKVVKEFYIHITKHYIEKLIRKDVEDSDGKKGFENPETFEGVNLIYNNRDVITNYLSTGILEDKDNVLVLMKSKSGYKVIMIIDDRLNNYRLILKTQMKGLRNYSKIKSDKIIKLYPNGIKKQNPS